MIRIKQIAALALGLIAFCFAGSIFAAVALPIGWYVEADGGYSGVSNTSFGSGTTNSNNGFAFGGDVGYKFMPYLAGEIGYIRYANITAKSSKGQFAKQVLQEFDIAAKGILPISDTGLELFAKLGATRLNSHITITNAAAATVVGNPPALGTKNVIGFFMGLGAAYSFLPNVQGLIQWSQAKGNTNTGNANFFSVGLAYIIS